MDQNTLQDYVDQVVADIDFTSLEETKERLPIVDHEMQSII